MKKKGLLLGLILTLALAVTHGTMLAAKTAESKEKKMEQDPLKKTADGQTLLNVNKGSIVIKSTGASGGG